MNINENIVQMYEYFILPDTSTQYNMKMKFCFKWMNETYIVKKGSQQTTKVKTMTAMVLAAFCSLDPPAPSLGFLRCWGSGPAWTQWAMQCSGVVQLEYVTK